MHAMTDDFAQAVRSGDWIAAIALAREGAALRLLEAESSSTYEWLLGANAPAELICELLRSHPTADSLRNLEADLMEACLRESATKANAFDTFVLLLDRGVSPNQMLSGGSTLLQRAMELNKIREVGELIRHGVDPNQTSAFGRESASNFEEAKRLQNEAAKVAVEYFLRKHQSNLD